VPSIRKKSANGGHLVLFETLIGILARCLF